MADKGTELAADLRDIYRCATQDLPEIASRWSGANGEMYGHANDSGAFSRSGYVPGAIVGGHQLSGTTVGRVYPYFDQLRDALQNLFAESANNTYAAGDALISIINLYAGSDHEAATELERLTGTNKWEGPAHPEVHQAE